MVQLILCYWSVMVTMWKMGIVKRIRIIHFMFIVYGDADSDGAYDDVDARQ